MIEQLFRPDIHVHPILPDLQVPLRMAYVSGLKDGALIAAVALVGLYLLAKEFWK